MSKLDDLLGSKYAGKKDESENEKPPVVKRPAPSKKQQVKKDDE